MKGNRCKGAKQDFEILGLGNFEIDVKTIFESAALIEQMNIEQGTEEQGTE